VRWPSPILAILFRPFGFNAPKTLNYLAFQSLDCQRTLWRLFQNNVVCKNFDIYVFFTNNKINRIAKIGEGHLTTDYCTCTCIVFEQFSFNWFLSCHDCVFMKLFTYFPKMYPDTSWFLSTF
jgi:hypothetical protein